MFAKSNVYFEHQLSIAKETNNVGSAFSTLHGLRQNYGHMGDDGNAMTYLDQTLVIESEGGDDRERMTYCSMGAMLVAQEGRKNEAILMFQNMLGCLRNAMPQKHLCGCSSNSVKHTGQSSAIQFIRGLGRCYRLSGERLIDCRLH